MSKNRIVEVSGRLVTEEGGVEEAFVRNGSVRLHVLHSRPRRRS
jgi:hypothetical protein